MRLLAFQHRNWQYKTKTTEGTDMHIYLASPLGFSPELGLYKVKIIRHLTSLGHTVCDPWKESEIYVADIDLVHASTNVDVQKTRALAVAGNIGRDNIEFIKAAD